MFKTNILPYDPKLKEKARYFRNNSTKAKIRLWLYLKRRQIMGYDFHRQKPIGNFIVDFFCRELMLAIELDGYTHTFEEVADRDEKKEQRLRESGVRVKRFRDEDVMNNIEGVMEEIEGWVKKHTP
ncbi:MAG: endonuclease domain-containing protein [Nitrospirota bacterium]|nr:endonuclease domain-containing protein [Nitrospirota bacterium]